MATGAADAFFRYVYDGCISGVDTGVERRPYHRNCRCALHNKSKENCPHGMSKCKNVSYPIRRSWSEGHLALASAAASNSCHSSPSSPSLQIGRSSTMLQLRSCQEEDDDDINDGSDGRGSCSSSSSTTLMSITKV